MLYQTDRGWLSGALVEKMVAPLTEAGREHVRKTYEDIQQHLQRRKDYKGLGEADVVILTFPNCEMNLADRAVLRWMLQESCDFTVHMEVKLSPGEDVITNSKVVHPCKLQVVLMW